MKKVLLLFLIITIIILSFLVATEIYAVDCKIVDVKYYNSLIENQKTINILLEKNIISRKITKEDLMEFDSKIQDIKSSNFISLSNNDLVKTGDYVTVNDEDYLVILYGDINQDGSICDINDILMIQNNFLGKQDLNPIEKFAGNLENNDNLLDIEDKNNTSNIEIVQEQNGVFNTFKEPYKINKNKPFYKVFLFL